MATLSDLKKTRDIKYISRDYDALVKDLKTYLKYQFPSTYNDFSDTSGGMAFLELIAYVGDILNYYIDKQFNELLFDQAQEKRNVIALAKNLGYIVRGKAAANTFAEVSIAYPFVNSETANLEFILEKGSQVMTDDSIIFETVSDVNFSTSTARKIATDATKTYVSISGIQVVQGETKSYQTTIGDSVAFLRVKLPDADVLEITSVTSSDGYTWYQADYLAQESQFYGVANTTSSSASVPYILTLRKIPRRFVIERDENNYCTLTFGSGILTTEDADYIPNPSDFVLPATLRGVEDGFTITSIDPENFINTGTLGAAPSNTILTVNYRTGGGFKTNVGAKQIRKFNLKNLTYIVNTQAYYSQRAQAENSMTVFNEFPASGGLDEETISDIKQFAAKSFAAQNRVVTIQDYIARTMTIPAYFGVPFRVQARRDPYTDYGVELVIIGRNSDLTLAIPSEQLKRNVGTYLSRFKPVNDTINIIDGKIVNIEVYFEINAGNFTNSEKTLANCLIKLKDYFKTDNWQMGQPISLSYITSIIQNIYGVLAVGKVWINNLYGTINGNTYSDTRFNVESYTRNGIISIEQDSIFEVKYPEVNIKGSLVN